MIEALAFPFMQKALLAGVVLGGTLSLLGVFVIVKRLAFFGDGIAHASLAGIAVGILTGFNPFAAALITGVLFGIAVFALERRTALSADAIIGVLFTSGLALGIVLLSLERGYQPDLIAFLFGNILALTSGDVGIILVLALGILTFLLWARRSLGLLVLDRNEAWLAGVPVRALELSLYVLLSVAIVLGVKLLGIILVSALLVIPPSTSALFTSSFRGLAIGSVVFGEAAVVLGLLLSYGFDLPSGATIILTASALFLVGVVFSRLFAQAGNNYR